MKRSSKRRRQPGKLTLGELRAKGLDTSHMMATGYDQRGHRKMPYAARSKCVAPCHRYVPTSFFQPVQP